MGILNVTPDSFSDGGLYFREKDAINRALQLEEEGADIIDIGGESTRPYSKPVKINEELKRVIPVIRKLVKKIKIPISIDTYKSEVARCALEEGASLVNDISALRQDKRLVEVVKKYNVPVVLMHMKGSPQNMQDNPRYKDVVSEVINFLRKRIEYLKTNGIKEDNIIIDPGVGFGKTKAHNLEILNRLDEFKALERPILIGTSRKSFIRKVLNLEVDERVFGTAATVAVSIMKGAHIVRVHDVKAMRQVSILTDAILNLN
ncbi:MAG: dihydropteroate synthase [Candidatus Omnitrophica bacterium]|nr:dihydropteroate synthase [Candidatus Omnitrophota bacterium]